VPTTKDAPAKQRSIEEMEQHRQRAIRVKAALNNEIELKEARLLEIAGDVFAEEESAVAERETLEEELDRLYRDRRIAQAAVPQFAVQIEQAREEQEQAAQQKRLDSAKKTASERYDVELAIEDLALELANCLSSVSGYTTVN
jgi:uncharacterized protein YdaT